MTFARALPAEESAVIAVDRQDFERLKSVIRKGMMTFIEVGLALKEINDRELYLCEHKTFEAFVHSEYGWERTRAYRMMGAATLTQELLPMGNIPHPTCERQVRPLAALNTAEARAAAWQEAVLEAGGKPPTAAIVEQVVRGILAPEVADPLPPPADGKFNIILADPPWRYESGTTTPNRVIENEYPTMALEDICALPVGEEWADKNAVLFLWATSPKLAEAMKVVEAWGFSYRTSFVWVKNRLGLGHYVRTNHELLLLAIRGKPGCPAYPDRPRSVVPHDKGRHSEKPAVFHEIIEQMYPTGRRLELFARQRREGWEPWGNEVEDHDGQDAREVPCGARPCQESRDSLFELAEEARL